MRLVMRTRNTARVLALGAAADLRLQRRFRPARRRRITTPRTDMRAAMAERHAEGRFVMTTFADSYVSRVLFATPAKGRGFPMTTTEHAANTARAFWSQRLPEPPIANQHASRKTA